MSIICIFSPCNKLVNHSNTTACNETNCQGCKLAKSFFGQSSLANMQRLSLATRTARISQGVVGIGAAGKAMALPLFVLLIGASLSEPHTSRTSVQSRYIY